MLTKQQAHKMLLIGYLIAIAGFIVGINSEIYGKPLLTGIYLAYICWSAYPNLLKMPPKKQKNAQISTILFFNYLIINCGIFESCL
jgi:hypothetical protein